MRINGLDRLFQLQLTEAGIAHLTAQVWMICGSRRCRTIRVSAFG